jgi:pimeloyl-ACP methyl ester carboxylesterase
MTCVNAGMRGDGMDFESTSRTVALEGGDLHYHEAGDGPPLVMLHGSGPGVSGWANFSGILSHFARHFRVIAPDLPGYGRTPAALGAPPPQAAKAVLAMMDALGIARTDIIGNSFGGMLGALLAAQHADRVRRLVCIGGIGFWTLSSFPPEGLLRLVEFVEDPSRDRLTAWLTSMVYDPAFVTEEMIEGRLALATRPDIMAASKAMYSRATFAAITANLRGPNALASVAHLASIDAQTLLCWGRDDRVNPLDGALLPMRLIPNCELHVFPKCGHWAMIEQKAAFEAVVTAFLIRD